jgi:hypothetical protein
VFGGVKMVVPVFAWNVSFPSVHSATPAIIVDFGSWM